LAGKNVILKPGQLLFKEGEASNGMFLVRKGDFDIFMHKDGTDVVLAKVGPGAMIGEMALFDKKPRSASVKATTAAEVTHISNEEFSKLMKQIPRWFVGLMGTLSGRLRQTNERLQKVESMRGRAFQGCLRVLHTLSLLWHKDGTKEGKDYLLPKAPAVEQLKGMFPEESDMLDDIILVLEQNKFVESRRSSQGITLATHNRGNLVRFADYVQEYTTKHTSVSCLPDEAFLILEALEAECESSAYDQFTLTMDDLQTKIAASGKEVTQVDWGKMFGYFKDMDSSISVVKTSDGGVGLRVDGKDIHRISVYHKMIRDMVDKNLA
jgi:CRP-like cAMP-binding protein